MENTAKIVCSVAIEVVPAPYHTATDYLAYVSLKISIFHLFMFLCFTSFIIHQLIHRQTSHAELTVQYFH